MNKEKFNLEKPKKEAKKHERKSISLVNELKIDSKEDREDLPPEEVEAYFWKNLYQEKLDEIKDDEEFKRAVIKKIKEYIKKGKKGSGYRANWALRSIFSVKDLKIYKKEIKEKLDEIKDDEEFKKIAIKDLEIDIRLFKNSDGPKVKWALYSILSMKDLEIYKKEIKEKINEIKNDGESKSVVIKGLESNIKEGQKGNGVGASLALRTIFSMEELEIYKKEIKEKLNKIKNSEDFKKAVIKYLENDIKEGKNGNGANAGWALWTILSMKNISEHWQNIVDEKQIQKARKNQKKDIPKRPEMR